MHAGVRVDYEASLHTLSSGNVSFNNPVDYIYCTSPSFTLFLNNLVQRKTEKKGFYDNATAGNHRLQRTKSYLPVFTNCLAHAQN